MIALEGEGASSARKHSFNLAKENWRAESGGLVALRTTLVVPGVLFFLDTKLLFSGHVHSLAGKAFLTLRTNGKFQGNDTGEVAAQLGFALDALLHASGRERALIIGFGTGTTTSVIERAV